ncbi:MAG: hypothetical protein ABL997_09765 [Planctomycetota bacterium]
MKKTPRAIPFGRMLDLCDELQRIRSRIADPTTGREERERLRRQTERQQLSLTRQLTAYRGRGPLANLLRKHRLDATEFEVLAVLLQRAVRAEEPEIEGRLILGSIFDSSFGVLSGLHLLAEDARLRTSGLVRVATDQPLGTDVLETRFRLSDLALSAMREEVAGRRQPRNRSKDVDGYRTQRELLLDLRMLHNHYRRRGELLFEPERWRSLHPQNDSLPSLQKRIDELWAEVRTRILRSEVSAAFPLLTMLREHKLGDAETMVVVHLLFQEIYTGDPHSDVADLMRLVSIDDSSLLRARSLFHKDAPLLKAQIVVLEPFVENRELTAEARLDDWVVTRLLDDGGVGKSIRSDERMRWHQYLSELDGSDGFFRDLDA